jgi:hypothetical protein
MPLLKNGNRYGKGNSLCKRSSSFKKKGAEFKVYCRDDGIRSMILLVRIVERRMKERERNLRDLLIKNRSGLFRHSSQIDRIED